MDRHSVVTVATSLYPVLHIAVVTAEFPVSVPIGSEMSSALGTDEAVQGLFAGGALFLNRVLRAEYPVRICPGIPARIRAEAAFLRFSGLDDFSATLRAATFLVRSHYWCGYIVSLAEGFHGVVREIHYLRDLLIPITL